MSNSTTVTAPHPTRGVDSAMRGQELQAIVKKFTEGFPSRPTPNGSAFLVPHENVYLLTGTTGCLGSNMLAQLLQVTATTRVYAFNRPSKSSTLRARQLLSFRQRGMNAALLSSEKLVYVEGDLSAPGFALDHRLYAEIHESVTHIIHNAWKVNLNISLNSFEGSISGLRALVDFAITSPLARPPHLLFVSSLAIFRNFENKGPVAEDVVSNPEVAVGQGYAESKWIVERILDAAAGRTSLRPVVVRLGQVCGEGNGTWNEKEWFPSVVKSGLTLNCLPRLDGTVSWITAPDAAAAMLEIAHIDPTPDAHTFHVVHPRGVSFNALVGLAASWLNVPLVPFPEWLSKLSQEHKTRSDLKRSQVDNPALRIFSFYETAPTGPEWEPIGSARLDTSRAVRVSKVLAEGAKPLGEENVRKWLGAWTSSGFLPPRRKKTAARM